MNIFVLDQCPIKSARMHCDKHVIKMILETAQMLSTAHHVLNSPLADELYAKTHENHPCSVWVRKSVRNYEWAFVLFAELSKIYREATGKTHKTWNTLGLLLAIPPKNIPSKPRTPFAIAMPSNLSRRNHPIESYRNYYCKEKARIAKFTYNPKPSWFNDEYVLPIKRRGGYKPTGRLALLNSKGVKSVPTI